MSKKPETPEEKWAAIAHLADDDDDEEESEEELDAALRAHGYDVEKIDERAATFAEKVKAELDELEARAAKVPAASASGPSLAGGADDSVQGPAAVPTMNVVPFETRRRTRWTVVLLGAAIAAMLAIGTALMVATRDQPWLKPMGPETPLPRPPEQPHEPTPQEMAANARRDARAACAKKEWNVCSAKLDDAARLDPDGELAKDVQTLRAAVNAAMVEEEKKRGKGGK
jgi:hypothetical protein